MQHKQFICTVTVHRLGVDHRWRFLSCTLCYKSAIVRGGEYRCTDPSCSSTDTKPGELHVPCSLGHACLCLGACSVIHDGLRRYSICTTSSDDTAEAEYMIFDRVARTLIGKLLIGLLQQRYLGFVSIKNFTQMGGGDVPLPPKVGRLSRGSSSLWQVSLGKVF